VLTYWSTRGLRFARIFSTFQADLPCDSNVDTMLMLRLIVVFVAFVEISAHNETVDPTISWFLKSTPFFDLTKVPQISAKCRRDFQTFLTAMENFELWALKSENSCGKK
jgi:hypothetical protein